MHPWCRMPLYIYPLYFNTEYPMFLISFSAPLWSSSARSLPYASRKLESHSWRTTDLQKPKPWVVEDIFVINHGATRDLPEVSFHSPACHAWGQYGHFKDLMIIPWSWSINSLQLRLFLAHRTWSSRYRALQIAWSAPRKGWAHWGYDMFQVNFLLGKWNAWTWSPFPGGCWNDRLAICESVRPRGFGKAVLHSLWPLYVTCPSSI